jgi:hypothetical protein
MVAIRLRIFWLGLLFLGGCDSSLFEATEQGCASAVIKFGHECDKFEKPATVAASKPWLIVNEIIMQENIAKYMVKPLHKAFFMNLADFKGWEVSSEPELQAAIDKADRGCRDSASSRGADPDRCTPVYVDEQQLLDWRPYTVPR